MTGIAHPIELDHIWKQYQLGSKHDSLRDAIPKLLQRWRGRTRQAHGPGSFWALKDLSFEVPQGQTLGLIGPNGAGKSTILKLLSRICKQTNGTIRVRGRLAALIEVGAGFHPDLTGRENIFMNGTIMGLSRRDIRRLFDAIVDFSEIEQFLDMPVKRYSSGMSVRLGFAIAAHINPDILLIDEVLAVGDLSFQHKCYQRIVNLKERGTTMIFISHNLEAVQRICDRVILLDEGRLLADDAPQQSIAAYRQQTARKQRFIKVWDPSGRYRVADTSKDMELTAVEFLNGEGAVADHCRLGEALRIRLRYHARRAIRSPVAVVTLERMDGLICHEASTRAAGLSWPVWEGMGALTLSYPRMTLSPNTYQVQVAVYEGQNPMPVARLGEPVYVHVVSATSTRGVAHVEHEWTLDAAKREMSECRGS